MMTMTSLARYGLLLASCTLTLACGESPGGGSSNPADAASYEWRTLVGPALGTGTGAPPLARKPLTVNATDTNGYKLGPAYVIQSAEDNRYSSMVVPVTNVSHAFECYVKAEGVIWRNSAGAALATGGLDFNFVDGTVAFDSPTVSVPKPMCLAQGATGYFFFIEKEEETGGGNLYDDLSSLEFRMSSSGRQARYADPVLVPQSYANEAGAIVVTVKNEGTSVAQVARGTSEGKYLVFDDGDLPLDWGFISLDPSSGSQIAPGQTATASSPELTFTSSGHKVAVIIGGYY